MILSEVRMNPSFEFIIERWKVGGICHSVKVSSDKRTARLLLQTVHSKVVFCRKNFSFFILPQLLHLYAMSRKSIITVNGVHKSYGPLHVLRGVSLEIPEAQITAIIGASGAGKSTLMHIMGTLDSPDKGEVFLDEKNVYELSSKQLAALRNQSIGFVFQFHHLLPEFTAVENVCIPAFIAGRKKSESESRAKELLALMGLKERFKHKPSELSGGEQQRVAVARALMNSPKIIFADEPSGNLDSANANELHALIQKLCAELNQTFVLITHNPDLTSVAHRVLAMKDGQIAA